MKFDGPVQRVNLGTGEIMGQVSAGQVLRSDVVTAKPLALAFEGSAREYFRIWVVNLCLTLVTAGIFSAWAKVRKKRYFYSHTVLDGTPFQYLGQPLPILKGRMVAALLFAVYYVAQHFFTSLLPYALAAGTVLAPWAIVRSAAFNARYSAFRNMTFQFDGTYWGAVKAIYAWGLIPALVVGTMFAWWNHDFVKYGFYAAFAFSYPWWLRRLRAFLLEHFSYGGNGGSLAATGSEFFKIYLTAGSIAVVGGPILMAAIIFRSTGASPMSAVVVFVLGIYVGLIVIQAYIRARTTNLVWNHTRLGPLRFKSSLHVGELAGLYLTNAIAIIASLGLLIPWAVIRTFKYRMDKMRVLLEGDLADFHGSSATAVQAAGAEVGEFFDLDLSL